MKTNQRLLGAAALLLTSTLSLAQSSAPSAAADRAPASAQAPLFTLLSTPPAKPAISYSSDGKLQFPGEYRQWIYLSSGFDMSYNPAGQPSHHMFGNVFVNPEAWTSFQQTGVWPDKTMLVLEFRGGEGKGSIVKGGQYQGSEVMDIEVHVRDDARFSDHWAFFSFDEQKVADVIPHSEDCYACHSAHGAVDNTFVQFYPTLLGVAISHKTLAPLYLEQK